MPSGNRDYGRFDELAEEFAKRYRHGERPSLQEYVDRLPEMADEIREMFPALAEVEQLEPGVANLLDHVKSGRRSAPLQQIGDYRILGEIGRGGMGVVYEAEQVSLGRRVALKVLPRRVAADRMTLERFRREARAAARLHHTNIVPVFEVGSDADVNFYAMQFIQGQSLDAVIAELRHLRIHSNSKGSGGGNAKDGAAAQTLAPSVAHSILAGGFLREGHRTGTSLNPQERTAPVPASAAALTRAIAPDLEATEAGPLSGFGPDSPAAPTPPSWAVLPGGTQLSGAERRHRVFHRSVAHIARQAAQALAHAHARGVIHRDIKPSNLLLDIDGVVWIADFGLAKAEDDDLTQTGDVLGTIRYMAPERFLGLSDARSDVYALGLTLYELLVMRPAFDSPNRLALIDLVKNADPPRPRSIDPRIPPDLETIVLKSIEKDPKARYASADAMSEDLRRFLADEPIHARQVSTVERYWRWARRNPVLAGMGAVLTAVLVLVTIGSLLETRRFANLADRAGKSASAERFARLEADQARKTAETATGAAKSAQQKTQQIAAQAEADKEIAQRENYRSTIKLAESMLDGDAQAKYRVADILWAAQPELRGWEWGHLMARCPLEEWALQTNQDGLNTLACSSDGKLLATAGRDGTVALWDSWTRKELWRQKTGQVETLAIDPRSRYIGIGSGETPQPAFRILEIAGGRIVHQAAESGTAELAFGVTGSDFFVLGDRALERFACDTAARLATIPVPRSNWPLDHLLRLFVDRAGAIVGVHDDGIGPAGGRLREQPRVSLFNSQTLRPVTDLEPILPTYAANLSSMARPYLNSGLGEIAFSEGPHLFVVEAGNNKPFTIEHPTLVAHLAFDPRSKLALAASQDGSVTLRDGDGEFQTLSHGAPIRGITMFRDGRFLTGGADGLIKCWKPGRSSALATITRLETSPASSDFVAFAEDGKHLLFQNFERASNWLFEMSTLSSRVLVGPKQYRHGFPLIQRGTDELVADTETGLDFYSLIRNQKGAVRSGSIDFARPSSAALDASGRILVASNRDREVAVFDALTHKRLAVPQPQGMGLVAINPAGTRAALLSTASLQVWDVATGRLLNRLDQPYGNLQVPNHELAIDERWQLVFHPGGDLVAFVKRSENSSSTIVLWDCTLGKPRQSIQTEPGRRISFFAFSPDGNRVFTDDGAIWDWRIGKELLALSGATATNLVAPSPDGVTLAIAGWSPSLRIAKALRWDKLTHRDAEFYRAVDDLWTFTEQASFSLGVSLERSADLAEIRGDIELRRARPTAAVGHYARAIEIRREIAPSKPGKAQPLYRLAMLHEKRLEATDAADPAQGVAALREATQFWRKLAQSGRPNQAAWRILLDFQLRLADLELARNMKDSREVVLAETAFWGEQPRYGADNGFVQYGLLELWARLAAAQPDLSRDPKAIDDLLEHHPELTVLIGDQYAAEKNWERAIATYTKPVTTRSGPSHARKLLALSGIGPEQLRAPLGIAAKASLRRRVLIWLKAELLRTTKLLESGPPEARPAVDQTVGLGNELAALRNLVAVAKLPADEQAAWQSLWAGVDALVKRLPAPTLAGNLSPEALDAIHRKAHGVSPAAPGEAEPLFRQALAGYRQLEGPSGHLTIDLTLDLAQVLDSLGRSTEAEPLYLEALETARKKYGPANPRTHTIASLFASHFMLLEKWTSAEPLLRDALALSRTQVGSNDPRLAGAMALLGLCLVNQGKWLEAESILRECLAIREKAHPDDWSTFNTRSLLGASLLGQKKFAAAEPLVLSGYEGMKARESKIPLQGKTRLNDAADRVVELYDAWGKKDKAAQWRAKLANAAESGEPKP